MKHVCSYQNGAKATSDFHSTISTDWTPYTMPSQSNRMAYVDLFVRNVLVAGLTMWGSIVYQIDAGECDITRRTHWLYDRQSSDVS